VFLKGDLRRIIVNCKKHLLLKASLSIMRNKYTTACLIGLFHLFCFNILIGQNLIEKPIWVRTGHDGFGSLAGLNEGVPTKNWKYFISVAGDGVIRFVNPESGELVKLWEVDFDEFENRTGVFVDIATSPDEKYLCTNSMHIWSIEGDTIFKKLEPGGKYVASPQFSNDGQFVAAAVWPEDKKSSVLKVWNMSNSTLQSQLTHSSAINKLAFMHQSNTIVFVDNSGGLYTWDMNMAGAQKIAQTIAIPNEFESHSFTLAPNDRYVLLADADATSNELWDIKLKSRKYHWKDAYAPKKMAFSPDSRFCAVESPGSSITIKSVETGLPVTKLNITLRIPSYLYFSPDGKQVLAVDVSNGLAEVLDIEKKEPSVRLLSHSGRIHAITVNDDIFLTTYNDGFESAAVQLFENDGRKVRWRIAYGTQKYNSDDNAKYMSFEAAALSPDKSYAAIIVDTDHLKKDSRGIAVINAADGSIAQVFSAHQSEISKIMFSADGQSLFTASRDSSIKVWDIPAGTLKKSFDIGSAVYSMAQYSDTLAALTNDDFEKKVVKISLLTEDKTEVILISNTTKETFDNVSKIALSPNGDQVALSYHWENVALWNTVSGKIEFVSSIGSKKAVASLAFSPDGKQLAIGTYDNVIQIWDAKAKKVSSDVIKIITPDFPLNPNLSEPGELLKPSYSSIAFSADGKTLLAGTNDANLIKLNVPLITSIEDLNNQEITKEDRVYPNPASSSISIPFSLKSEKLVSLCIFDINGRELDCILKEKELSTGDYTEEYSVEKLPTGVYYYTLRINNIVYQHKFSVVR
jgi:WD40 repeat protein